MRNNRLRRIAVIGENADADAGVYGDGMALQQKGLAQILKKPLTNANRIGCFCEIAQYQEKLIAALTRKRVSSPDSTGSAVR